MLIENVKYTTEDANTLIEKWKPILVGYAKIFQGEKYIIEDVTKEAIGDKYYVWAESNITATRFSLSFIIDSDLTLLDKLPLN